jgi:hypothetical protein
MVARLPVKGDLDPVQETYKPIATGPNAAKSGRRVNPWAASIRRKL